MLSDLVLKLLKYFHPIFKKVLAGLTENNRVRKYYLILSQVQ